MLLNQLKIRVKLKWVDFILSDISKMKIGVDIGGVLVGKGESSNHLFDVPNSLDALKYLSSNNYLYIISYCKERRAQISYDQLVDLGLFWSQYYVSEKSFKSSIISYLDCDVMIDDRENILDDIKTHNPTVVTILFQRYNKQKKTRHKLHYLAEDWDKVVEIIESIKPSHKSDGEQKDPKGSGYFIS